MMILQYNFLMKLAERRKSIELIVIINDEASLKAEKAAMREEREMIRRHICHRNNM